MDQILQHMNSNPDRVQETVDMLVSFVETSEDNNNYETQSSSSGEEADEASVEIVNAEKKNDLTSLNSFDPMTVEDDCDSDSALVDGMPTWMTTELK